MSSSFDKSFGRLAISDPTTAQIAIDIPTPEIAGRHMFYGFAVDQEGLAAYGRSVCTNQDPRYDDFTYSTIALNSFAERTGIKSLAFQAVYVSPSAPRNTKYVIATNGVNILLIISVCSSSIRSFQRRPTQAAVDQLAMLLGGKKPIWWTSTT